MSAGVTKAQVEEAFKVRSWTRSDIAHRPKLTLPVETQADEGNRRAA
jgi:hypothetical protein